MHLWCDHWCGVVCGGCGLCTVGVTTVALWCVVCVVYALLV